MDTYAELLKDVIGESEKSALWSRKLDMTNPKEAELVAAQFGGREWLGKHYPLMTRTYENTLMHAAEVEDTDDDGFCDKADILEFGYDEDTQTVCGVGTINLTETAKRMCMVICLYAADTLIARNVNFLSGCSAGSIQVESTQVDKLNEGELYHAYMQVTWESTNTNVLRSVVSKADAYAESVSVIADAEVSNPIHINSDPTGPIMVAYDRKSSQMDYSYTLTNNKKREVMLKVSGTATLKDGYIIKQAGNVGMELARNGVGVIEYKGGVEYGNQGSQGVTIFPLENGKKFGWNFDEDWNNTIKESTSKGNGLYAFRLTFDITCSNTKENSEKPIKDRIIIASDKTKKKLNSFEVNISMIKLYWGCLAKDTQVLMADGTCKSIQDIKSGDVLMSPESGKTVKVKSLVEGTEQCIYNILLSDGKTVMATKDHPFATKDDFITVINMDCQTELMTKDGLATVEYCYPSDYSESVYSIDLEDGSGFFANGIVSGSNAVMGAMMDRDEACRLTVKVDDEILNEQEQMMKDYNEGHI